MSKIIVFVEVTDGNPGRASLEALGAAKATGSEVVAVSIGGSGLALDASAHPDLVGRGELLLQQLDGGATLTQALETLPLVDDLLLQAIAHAEHTGVLDDAFAQQAKRHQEQARRLQLTMISAVVATAVVCVVVTIGIALVQGVQGYFDWLNDIVDSS